MALAALGIHSPRSVAHNILESLERSLQGDYDCYPSVIYNHLTVLRSEFIPSYLSTMTNAILKRYGAPSQELLQRLNPIFQPPADGVDFWDTSALTERGWGWEQRR